MTEPAVSSVAPPPPLAKALAARVVVFDGAMGTELYKRNFFVNTSFEGLNLTAPSTIQEIHRRYFEAGAEVMTTNSYGANRNILAKYGLAEKMHEICAAAVRLAREGCGNRALIAGSVGPLGEVPFDSGLGDAAGAEILAEHGRTLLDAGADFLLFETLTSLADLTRALQAVARIGAPPYVLSLSVDRQGESARGEPLAALVRLIGTATPPPLALGLNCGEGPESTLGALEKLAPLTTLPLIVQPNAGVPKSVDGRTMYMTNPEYLTTYALRYVTLGARGVGGCCGTGPEHIRDIARSVRPVAGSGFAGKALIETHAAADSAPLRPAMPLSERSGLARKLAARAWITTVEITPPRGYDLAAIVSKARQCREAGIDAINIPDGPRASARLSPLVTAHRIQRDAGIEAILHFCCRDKNLIGMQADLLGCAALDVHNLLFITGDPPKLGDYPFASAVFDADSIGMARIQHRLNRGVDLGGKPIEPPTRAVIGVGADPNAIDMKRELRRMREKAEAGAEFVITQPVFDVAPLLRFLDAIGDLNLPVIAGIWPLASYRNAEFMRNEVPGVVVPDAIMQRMARAPTKEEQTREGIAIASESIAAIRSRVGGVQVSAPFGNVNTAIAVATGR